MAWAEEGDGEKGAAGVPGKNHSSLCSQHFREKNKESSKCFVIFCVMAELGIFNIDLYT